jgi:hypothetical protein
LAVDGCCKQRPSYQGNWYKNGLSYAKCKQQNERDRDNIFDQSGLIWWDMRCR